MENYSLIIICVLLFGFLGVLEIICKFGEKRESKKSFTVYVYKKFKYISSEFKIAKRQGNFNSFPLMEKNLESYAMLMEEVAIDYIDISSLKKQLKIINEWEEKHQEDLQKEFERSIATHNSIKEIYKEKENIKSAVLSTKRK
ncbi:hypothetical protein [Faecalibacillus intestinalis]|uniref:hypothetical protein n=1 Tax=Faecalibacillus intestinalis TaxID=1982626 RepID=UPI0022E2F85B|nr:hypothetical protein [Faecalibacillus intestinalis]